MLKRFSTAPFVARNDAATERVDAPACALPREQRDERVDHRGRRIDRVVRAHQRDTDGVRVVVDRVPRRARSHRCSHRCAAPGAGSPAPSGLRRCDRAGRSASCTRCRCTRPTVSFARMPRHKPGVVRDVVRRAGVVHDDLRDGGVVGLTGLAQRLVRTPLRTRHDRRHRPVRDRARTRAPRRRGRRARRPRGARGTARPTAATPAPAPSCNAARRVRAPRSSIVAVVVQHGPPPVLTRVIGNSARLRSASQPHSDTAYPDVW